MKKCPACEQVFDDNNGFCLNDGTPLVRIGSGSYDMPTQIVPPPVSGNVAMPAKQTSPILFLIIGLLAAGLIAAIVFIYAMPKRASDDEQKKVETQNTAPLKTSAPPSQSEATNTTAPAAQPPHDPTLTPQGNWTGDWDGKGAAFTAEAYFTETSDHRVDGRIVWKLVRSSNPQQTSKYGLTATEYVRGTFDPASRAVALRGYRVDDPSGLHIRYDNYDLVLSEDKRTISGKSVKGVFTLRR